jgi:S1-C subfamily serine protease
MVMFHRFVTAGFTAALCTLEPVALASARTSAPTSVRCNDCSLFHLVQRQSPESPAIIYRQNIHGVFTIVAEGTLGTGFVFKPGYIVTNAHVVGGASVVDVETQEGSRFRATVISKNVDLDFAVLKPEFASQFVAAVALLRGATPEIGEAIVVIGAPGGLKGSVTSGIVSQIYPDGVIQLNVSINPGNSGGPVFDSQGRVFGIATAKYARGDGLGFAIPIERLDP